jgi:hypothetical protein
MPPNPGKTPVDLRVKNRECAGRSPVEGDGMHTLSLAREPEIDEQNVRSIG